jgi:hypothetical protein
MDESAWQAELEAMASNAIMPIAEDDNTSTEAIGVTMARWQRLFGLSPDDAVDRIMGHRQNLTRTRVSDEHWSTVCHEKELQGYDRESYEYEIELQKKKAHLPALITAAEDSSGDGITYLVELAGPLHTVDMVQTAAGMAAAPPVKIGRSVEEGEQVQLCCIDGNAKANILRWASEQGGGYEPVILVDPRSLR